MAIFNCYVSSPEGKPTYEWHPVVGFPNPSAPGIGAAGAGSWGSFSVLNQGSKHEFSSTIFVCRWCIIKYYHIIIYYDMLLSYIVIIVLLYYDVLLCMIMYYDVLSCIIVYYVLQSSSDMFSTGKFHI